MRAEVHAGDQKEGISLVELGELCVFPGKLSHVSVTSQTNWLLTVPNLKQKKRFNSYTAELHRYSNEAKRTNLDIYDDFKLKKPFDLHGLYKIIQ